MNTSKLPIVGALIERLRRRSDHESIKAAMASKGDVTKVAEYRNMSECLDRLSTLENGTGSLGKPLAVARRTHLALIKHRPSFTQAFGQDGSEGVRFVYAAAVAGLFHTVSLLCAEGVMFVKGADGNYTSVVNRNAVDMMANSVIVTRLEKFADTADRYGFVNTITESAPMMEREAFHEAIGLIAGAALAVTAMAGMLMLARDLAEKFYSLRGTFSRWLEIQARFLEMNAMAINNNTGRAQQEAYAARFRALAERIKVDDADTERQATTAIQQDDRDMERAQRQNTAAMAIAAPSPGRLL